MTAYLAFAAALLPLVWMLILIASASIGVLGYFARRAFRRKAKYAL